MHIYLGGAHNGKRAFVRNLLLNEDVEWFEDEIPDKEVRSSNKRIVSAGIENWLAKSELSEEQAIEIVMDRLNNKETIVILTDIGRGIVPMDTAERRLRDVCGRLNQKLVAQAEEVTRIWYGIPQLLKKRGDVQ